MKPKNIVVMGAGGFGPEAMWVLEDMNKAVFPDREWNILGYVADEGYNKNIHLYDYTVIGTPGEISQKYIESDLWFYCAIGDNLKRKNITERLRLLGWHEATLVHPSVIIAKHVEIGEGTYVGAGAILCPYAKIGKHVLINVRSAIGHNVVLGDYSQVCPGAQINGFCEIYEGATIGSNASVLPGKSVGAWAKVGSNAQVVCSTKPGITVNGVPAMKIG